MKRILCFVFAMLICVSIACPAFAAEDTFTPSVPYKDAPEIVPIEDPDGEEAIGVIKDENGEIIDYVYVPCLVVTPVSQAETSTEIPDDARQLLLSVYAQLSDGSMQLPYEKFNANLDPEYMVIRDLFDATFLCGDHPEMLEEEGIVLELTFDLNVKADVEVFTMTYKNDEWNPIVSTVNNGDGTVTCTFEHLCPIAFSVETDRGPSQTGDNMATTVLPWALLMVASSAALVVMIAVRRKKA